MIQPTGCQKIGLKKYRDQKQDHEASTVFTTEPQEEDWDQDLTLHTPTAKWGHLMNQLNQDPREDSVTNSG